MEKTKVSACIVTYGGYEEAVKAAQSLLQHTKETELSLYLVDNASPDGTGEKAAAGPVGPARTGAAPS